QAADRVVGALLLGHDPTSHERLALRAQGADVALVVVTPVVLSLLEGHDGGLLSEGGGSTLDELREAAPGARVLGGLAAELADLLLEQARPLQVRLAQLTERVAELRALDLLQALVVALDGGQLAAQEGIELLDVLLDVFVHDVSPSSIVARAGAGRSRTLLLARARRATHQKAARAPVEEAQEPMRVTSPARWLIGVPSGRGGSSVGSRARVASSAQHVDALARRCRGSAGQPMRSVGSLLVSQGGLEGGDELPGAGPPRVGAEDDGARRRREGQALLLRGLLEEPHHVRGLTGHDDRLVGGEQLRQPGPVVTDDRGPARPGLEEADARGPAGFDHVRAGDVEGEALLAIEGRVLGGGQVLDPLHVLGPADVRRVEGARDDEAPLRSALRGFEEQALEGRLPVGAVGAEVAEIPARRRARGAVALWFDGAMEGDGAPGPQLALDALEGRAAREGEVEIEERDLPASEVLLLLARELRQGDGRVDVVEGDDAPGDVEHGGEHLDALGHIGSDEDRVGALEGGAVLRAQLSDASVELEVAEVRSGQVSVRGVPGDVPLQEQHLVAELAQPPEQGSKGRRVAVAPGGREREADHHDVEGAPGHEAVLPQRSPRRRVNTSSTWRARRS